MKVEATLHEKTTSVEIHSQADQTFEIVLGVGKEAASHTVRLLSRAGNRWTLEIANRIEDVLIYSQGGEFWIDYRGGAFQVRVQDLRQRLIAGAAGLPSAKSGILTSQMPGKVVEVLKQPGDQVEAGQGLVVIEAMKMQNELKAPRSGVVKVCNVQPGQAVENGQLLFEIE